MGPVENGLGKAQGRVKRHTRMIHFEDDSYNP
jgi:hypothetical protein